MNKSRIILIIVAVVLVVLVLFLMRSDRALKYQWTETYRTESDQPYGTLFIRKLLEHQATEKFIYNKSQPAKAMLANPMSFHKHSYVVIGQSVHYDSDDIDALLSFIYAGNDVFIATMSPPAGLVEKIHGYCEGDFQYAGNYKMTARLNFFNDALKKADGYDYTYHYGREDAAYFWYSLYPDQFCDSTKMVVPLGNHDETEVNFLKLPHGSGNLYLHTTPLAFTNYFMIHADKADYASVVFSHLAHRQNVIWDEYSKIPFVGNQNSHDTPLYYIMQQPSLKYGWWMLLATVALYVVFAAKRAHRPIPVLEKKSNTSLEFVKMISSLHYVNGNHYDMVKKKMKYFLYFIRSKYGIHETTFASDTITKLAEKSKVNREIIADIINQYNEIEASRYNVLPEILSSFFDAVEKFYRHCK